MFTRIWQWLTGSYVHNAINGFEKAKATLETAVAKETAILENHVEKKRVAFQTSTDIQAAIKADYERQVQAEAARLAALKDKIDTKIVDKSVTVSKGSELLAKLNGVKVDAVL